MNRKSLDRKIFSIAVFRNVTQDKTINDLWKLIGSDHDNDTDIVNDYAWFISRLYNENINLSEYILKKMKIFISKERLPEKNLIRLSKKPLKTN